MIGEFRTVQYTIYWLDRSVFMGWRNRTLHFARWTWGMNFSLKTCIHLRITKKKDHIIFNYQLGPNIISSFTEEKIWGYPFPISWPGVAIFWPKWTPLTCYLPHELKRSCGNHPQRKVFLNLYIHLGRPHLEYACEVWSRSQSYLTDIIEDVQLTATRIIPKDKPYREKVKELHLLSLATGRVYFDLIFLFKMKLGLLDYFFYCLIIHL